MLFAILFGLSMDYQVFLVSRMHEEWVHTERQPARGHRRAGRDRRHHHGRGDHHDRGVPRLRAEPGRAIKIFGIGLAAAVFLDAFVLRTDARAVADAPVRQGELVLPRWLDRITPHVSVDPADEGDTDDQRERELTRI